MNTTESIWDQYREQLAAFLRSRVESQVVDDLLQEVFVKVHKHLDSLEESGKIKSWLYQITRNVVIDHYRSRRSTEDLTEWSRNQDDSGDEQVRREFASCLHPIVKQLPEKYRTAIRLSEIEGKTQQEVADQIGISLSGVKSQVQRGRALLRGLLHECCQIELNRHNQLISYEIKDGGCQDCQ